MKSAPTASTSVAITAAEKRLIELWGKWKKKKEVKNEMTEFRPVVNKRKQENR